MIVKTDEKNYQDIADAIRSKNGTEQQYMPSEMAEAIANIPDEIVKNTKESIVELGLSEEDAAKVASIIDAYYNNNKERVKTFVVLSDGGFLAGDYGVVLYRGKGQFYQNLNSFSCDILIVEGGIFLQNNGSNFCFNQNITIFLGDVTLFNYNNTAFRNSGQIIQNGSVLKFTKNYSNTLTISSAWSYYRGESIPQFAQDDFDDYYCYSSFAYSKIKEVTPNNFATLRSKKPQNCYGMFLFSKIEKYTIPINPLNFEEAFLRCYYLREVKNLDFISVVSIVSCFTYCNALQDAEITNWRNLNLSFADSPNLSPTSINYLIENCDKDGGTLVARTLTLHADAKANWQASEQYEYYQAMATEKLITIA